MKTARFVWWFVLLGACTTAWDRAGIPRGEVKGWKQHGFRPEEAGIWRRHGFSPDQAVSWRALLPLLGDTSLDRAVAELARWARHFPAERAEGWMRNVFPLEEAALWDSAGFSPEEAHRWRTLGFDPGTADPWKAYAIPPEEALLWSREGISPDEAARWKEVLGDLLSGHNSATIFAWAKVLRREGITPDTAKTWFAVLAPEDTPTKSTLEEVVSWHRQGFSPEEAKYLAPALPPEVARQMCPRTMEWEKVGHQLNLARIFLPGTRDDPNPLLDCAGRCILDVKARWEYTLSDETGLVTLSTKAGRFLGYVVELFGGEMRPSFEELLNNPRTAFLELCGPRSEFLKEIPERKGLWFEGPVKVVGVREVGRGKETVYLPHLMPLSCFAP